MRLRCGAKQKFKLSVRSIIDPASFLIIAGIAGAEAISECFPGVRRRNRRIWKAIWRSACKSRFGQPAVEERSILLSSDQDPRYFYKGKGSFGSRALYAMSAAVIARGDDGRWKPNYSNVLGNFSAGAISNLYYPEVESRGFACPLQRIGGYRRRRRVEPYP